MHKKIIHIMPWLLFAGILLFLTMNRHSRSGQFNYHSEIWGDKAGYYMYLPAALKYDFDPAAFPDSMDVKTGNGFQLDLDNHRVITKYTYGTALMQLPFYLVADLVAPFVGQPADGFSPVYHKVINVASIFYLVLGLYFLFQYLRKSFAQNVVLAVLFSIVFGTNLYYYSVDETGMSHVYSFFLFSAFLLMMQRWFTGGRLTGLRLVLLAAVASLIVLVRPTNLFFILFAFVIFISRFGDFRQKLFPLFRPWKLILIIMPAVVLFIPQIIYWSYAYGGLTFYSYSGEGFNWLNPQPHITLFSPDNGLLLYTPFYLIVLFAVIRLISNCGLRWTGVKVLVFFLLITYIFSCWWTPEFGCGFGARNYVEYYAAFALPLVMLYKDVMQKSTGVQITFWLVVLAAVAFNMKMTYTWDECFYGDGYWDWAEYFRVVMAPTK